MSCYHPYMVTSISVDNEGKKHLNIKEIPKDFDYAYEKSVNPNLMLLPCGKCIGCRLDYSRRWADRMMLELDSCGSGIFVTLTYNCRNLVDLEGDKLINCQYADIENTKECPNNKVCGEKCKLSGSLYKRHVQLFMKKFRKEMEKYGKRIRFYAVGEYGDFTQYTHRPHYHLILFGVGTDFFKNAKFVGYNELRQPVWTHPIIANAWDYGNVSFGNVSWKSCAYVARYVTKKALDIGSEDLIDMLGKNHTFSLMSRKPGIGRIYLEEHPDCLDNTNIYISTPEGARKISLPRYFVNQLNRKVSENSLDLDLYDPDKYDTLIAQRALYAEDSMLGKLANTDLDFLSYLEVEEEKTLDRIKSLKRDVKNLY